MALLQWGHDMVLLGFMVVTGISQILQFQVIGNMQGMNSNEIWTVCKLEKVLQVNQMCNMPDALPVIPMLIPDPSFVKRKVFLAKDAGNDHDNGL